MQTIFGIKICEIEVFVLKIAIHLRRPKKSGFAKKKVLEIFAVVATLFFRFFSVVYLDLGSKLALKKECEILTIDSFEWNTSFGSDKKGPDQFFDFVFFFHICHICCLQTRNPKR